MIDFQLPAIDVRSSLSTASCCTIEGRSSCDYPLENGNSDSLCFVAPCRAYKFAD